MLEDDKSFSSKLIKLSNKSSFVADLKIQGVAFAFNAPYINSSKFNDASELCGVIFS